jgi:pyrroloquinoline quinone (PQQ) biosynthesis protein C
MIQNDPRMQQIMQMIGQNGGNGKELFYRMAQERGVDPNQIIYQTQAMLNTFKK